MKTRVGILALALLALTSLLVIAAPAPVVNTSSAAYYYVVFTQANEESVTLIRGIDCPTPCNTHGVGTGYRLYLGYGDTEEECMIGVEERDHLVDSPRQEWWWPCHQEPEVGDVACIFWCCQPAPAMMYFDWEFMEIE